MEYDIEKLVEEFKEKTGMEEFTDGFFVIFYLYIRTNLKVSVLKALKMVLGRARKSGCLSQISIEGFAEALNRQANEAPASSGSQYEMAVNSADNLQLICMGEQYCPLGTLLTIESTFTSDTPKITFEELSERRDYLKDMTFKRTNG